MKFRYALPVLMLAALGCEADEEVFEEGATLDEPAAVEQAPVAPIPPQPIAPPAGDTLQEIEIDVDTAGS